MPDIPSLRVGGGTFDGWESVTVTRSLEIMPDTFSLEATVPRIDIPAGARCEVCYGSDVVLTGMLEKPRWRRDANGRSFGVSGRSLPGNLVDCAAKPGVYLGLDLGTLGWQLAEPYGVDVRVAVGVNPPTLPRVVVKPGQTVYEVLEKQARSAAMLWLCGTDGVLVLTVPGQVRASTTLAFPAVESIETSLDLAKRVDVIECRGQIAGDGGIWGVGAFSVGTVTDASLKGKRKIIINAPNRATAQQCADRAAIEAAARYGKSVSVPVKASSWRDPSGALWQPGRLYPTREEWWGLDTPLILRSVTMTYGAKTGTSADLDLTVPQAYLWERIAAADPKLAKGLRVAFPELLGNW